MLLYTLAPVDGDSGYNHNDSSSPNIDDDSQDSGIEFSASDSNVVGTAVEQTATKVGAKTVNKRTVATQTDETGDTEECDALKVYGDDGTAYYVYDDEAFGTPEILYHPELLRVDNHTNPCGGVRRPAIETFGPAAAQSISDTSNACFELEEFMSDNDVIPEGQAADAVPTIDQLIIGSYMNEDNDNVVDIASAYNYAQADVCPVIKRECIIVNFEDAIDDANVSGDATADVCPVIETECITVNFDDVATSKGCFPKSIKDVKLRERFNNLATAIKRPFKNMLNKRKAKKQSKKEAKYRQTIERICQL